MSETRKAIYLLVSAGLHVLAAVVIVFLSQSSEHVYEDIEVTSYVTPVAKSSESKSVKPVLHKINEIAEKTKEVKNENNIQTGNGSANSEGTSEELAQDSAITAPAVLITRIKANRTEAARQADFSGIAQVELVVSSDGSVKDAKLRNSLPYGLDEVALRLARESKFKPAMVNNKPVASAILFKVRFESEK